ncbi:MAG: rhomboid family intramembrane serine protease [Rhizobiaceae bacterium]
MTNDPDSISRDNPQTAETGSPRDATGEAPQRKSEPIFNVPFVVVILAAICVGIHVIRVYLLTPEQDFDLLVRAAFVPIRYFGPYDLDVWAFTSPISYAFLHGNFTHLLLNMVWFVAFGSPLANRLAPARFLAFWVAAGLGAVVLHYALHHASEAPLVGASGAISGMMGAAARYGFRIDRSSGTGVYGGPLLPVGVALTMRPVVSFLAVWFVINLVTGLVGFAPNMEDASIAWEAHIGGFLVGFFGIGLFDRGVPRPVVRSDNLNT